MRVTGELTAAFADVARLALPPEDADESGEKGRALARLKTAIDDMNNLAEEARSANRAKSEFLANMSHEIRTPMNGVIGMLDLALETELTGSQLEYLQLAKSSAEALLYLLNDILDFSKIEAGKLKIEETAFRLSTVMRAALTPLEFQAREKGLTVTTRVDPDLPERLVGDPYRLRQIIVNLVRNAVKFTETGEIAVSINRADESAGAVPAGPGTAGPPPVGLQICVRDTGIGIPEERLETLFDAFVQADGSITRSYGGAGLGLNISKKLAGLMGGRIWGESRVGQGSAFYVALPMAVPSGDGPIAGAKALPDPPRAPPPAEEERARILLAEDDSVNQKVFSRFLKSRGYAPTIVEDGRAAVAAAHGDGGFDLILMDLRMPVMDGLEATRRIREQDDKTPIIALTAHAYKEDRRRCLAAGMNGYIAKPVDRDEFFKAVEGYLPLVRSAGRRDDRPAPDRPAGNPARKPPPERIKTFTTALRSALEAGDAFLLEKTAREIRQTAGGVLTPAALDDAFRLVLSARAGDLDKSRTLAEGLIRYMSNR